MIKVEPKYLNSAGRLLAILQCINDGQSVSDQLIPLVFGEHPGNDQKRVSSLGVKAITELHILYANFLDDLASADMEDEERTVLEKGLTSLQSLMYPQALNQGLRAPSDAEKALLEVCATRFSRENPVADEDIDCIRESISYLREQVDICAKNLVLRKILLEIIRLSEDSINRYHIYGAEGLKKAFKGMLSEVAEIYMQDENAQSEIRNSSAWNKAVEHLKLFDTVASKTMEYQPLIETASQFLLGG